MTALPKHEPRQHFVGNSNTAPKLAWWYVLCVQSGQMPKLLERLECEAGIEAFYPARMSTRQGKRLPSGKRELLKVKRPLTPGYLFARFHVEPEWRTLSDELRVDFRPLRRADGEAGKVIHDKTMHRLYQKRVQIIDLEPEEVAQVKEGDKVAFDMGGTRFEGVEVLAISGKFATVNISILGSAHLKVALEQVEQLSS